MAWSDEESLQMFESYWSPGYASCPKCGASVRYNYSRFFGGYMLTADCPRGCGGLNMNNGQDPVKDQFRDWTEAEVNEVIDAHFKHQRPTCPVDGARVTVNENPMFEGNLVTVTCPRCNQDWKKNFPRS